MADSTYIFVSGTAIEVGSHGDTDYLFSSGTPVENGADGDGYVYESGSLLGDSNPWEPIADYPDALTEIGGTVYNDEIYLICGDDGTFSFSTNCYKYDPSTDTFTTLSNAPDGMDSPTAGEIGGVIHASGFSGDRLYEYDISADSWATGPSGPLTQIGNPSWGVRNGSLWIANSGGGVAPDLLEWDDSEDSWTDYGSPLITTASSFRGGLIGPRLYYEGGGDYKYWNVDTDTQADVADPPDFGQTVVDPNGDLRIISDTFSYVYDEAADSWSSVGDTLPDGYSPGGLVSYDGAIYAFSGQQDGSRTSDCYKLVV